MRRHSSRSNGADEYLTWTHDVLLFRVYFLTAIVILVESETRWQSLSRWLHSGQYVFFPIQSHAETAWKEFSVAHFTLSSLKSCICASPSEGKTPVTLWHVFLACFHAAPRKHHTLIWEMLQPFLLLISLEVCLERLKLFTSKRD